MKSEDSGELWKEATKMHNSMEANEEHEKRRKEMTMITMTANTKQRAKTRRIRT